MKAIIIGTTGLIGNHLTDLLEKDDFYAEIEVWVRKSFETTSPKTTVKIIDFDHLPEMINTNHVYCCIGTTIKKAGTWEAFRKIDFDIPVNIAKRCMQGNVEKLLIISSLGADQKSANKYLQTKGEMENTILQYTIPSVSFLRPSLLLGKREEFRLGELIGKFFMQAIAMLLIGKFKKYRGIQASTVAKAMFLIAKANDPGIRFIESDEIESIGK